MYKIFGLTYDIELSTRPEEKYIGDIEIWNKSEKALEEACHKAGHECKINPGDGAFYGPKLDFHIRDSIGRVWQCGTIQLDMNLPERFDLTYIDNNGERARPVVIHRAILGSSDRFISFLLEETKGNLPFWVSPKQIKILPIADRHLDKAKEIKDKIAILDEILSNLEIQIQSHIQKITGDQSNTFKSIKKDLNTMNEIDMECNCIDDDDSFGNIKNSNNTNDADIESEERPIEHVTGIIIDLS